MLRAVIRVVRTETIVADPGWVAPLLWVGFPLLGGGAGWLLKWVVEWVASLSGGPFHPIFEFIASIAEPQATIGAVAVGLVAGLALAYAAAQDSLTVAVSDDRVNTTRGGSTQDIPRASVAGVFLDGKKLVLLGRAGEELAREGSDLDRDRLREAFQAHGFPWLAGGDPYRDEYRRWVPDMPDLPAAANALLKARARALDKGDGDDVKELRSELAKLGVVVRDEKKRQYWRQTEPR